MIFKNPSQRKKVMLLLNGERVSLNKKNTHRIPRKVGYYLFFINGKPVYVGHANNLRHRVESYNEKDDYGTDGHPSKKHLRDVMKHSAVQFEIHRTSNLANAESKEKKLKTGLKYNMDNTRNHD